MTEESLTFGYRKILWEEPNSVEFKNTVFVILHKPRFIIQSKRTKIVVPMLSHEFTRFAETIHSKNELLGKHIYKIYENARAYYVDNIEVVKELNTLGKKAV